jgi:hypothetical protein
MAKLCRLLPGKDGLETASASASMQGMNLVWALAWPEMELQHVLPFLAELTHLVLFVTPTLLEYMCGPRLSSAGLTPMYPCTMRVKCHVCLLLPSYVLVPLIWSLLFILLYSNLVGRLTKLGVRDLDCERCTCSTPKTLPSKQATWRCSSYISAWGLKRWSSVCNTPAEKPFVEYVAALAGTAKRSGHDTAWLWWW